MLLALAFKVDVFGNFHWDPSDAIVGVLCALPLFVLGEFYCYMVHVTLVARQGHLVEDLLPHRLATITRQESGSGRRDPENCYFSYVGQQNFIFACSCKPRTHSQVILQLPKETSRGCFERRVVLQHCPPVPI